MKPRIMYIELKSGHSDDGPARIGRVTFSRTGKTIYYRGHRFQSLKGGGYANYVDIDTGDEYWISGCKKNGEDRHWAGSGLVEIDEDVREEYWTEIRGKPDRTNEATIR
ncbi:MAG: 1-deoxy-D-xylulose-5-phosphate synthase [Phycisphaerae bacterium]